MATQQQTFNIMEAIIDAMSGKPDLLMTIHNVHARLYEKYKPEMSDPLKRDEIIRQLKKTFREIEIEYDNIYRIFRGTGEYLIWSLKSRDEILQGLDSPQTYEDYLRNGTKPDTVEYRMVFPNIEVDLQLPKEKTVLEKIIGMVGIKDFGFVFDTATIDGKLTAIQYLVQINQLDLLRQIHNLSNIPFSDKCSELAMETGNCDMVEFVLKNSYEQRIRSLQNQNDLLKETHAKLYDQMRSFRADNQSLRIECDSSRVGRLTNKIKSYLLFFMIIYLMFFQ